MISEDNLIFLDEFPEEGIIIAGYIKFTRNLSRALNIPSVVAGTDLNAKNLIGKVDIQGSRKGAPRKWVLVITKLPKLSLESLKIAVKIKSKHQNSHQKFIADFFINGTDQINFGSLFNFFQITEKSVRDSFKKLIQFLLNKSRNSLPGIVLICFNIVMEKLYNYNENEI